MITPQELRLGNIVRDEVSGELMRITELSETTACGTVINREKYPLPPGWKMGPVVITPEVLRRCGFVGIDGHYCLGHRTLKSMDLTATEYDGKWSVYLHGYNFQHSVRCFDLHSLMNLFFTLTGEELKYTI